MAAEAFQNDEPAVHAVPDPQVTYQILRQLAQRRLQRTVMDLALAYAKKTGTYIEPNPTWEDILAAIDRRLEKSKLPPLSGLIIVQSTNQPGYTFWGSCQRTSVDLKNADARRHEYALILKEIYDTTWPPKLP